MADEFERDLLIGIRAVRGSLIDRESLLDLIRGWLRGGEQERFLGVLRERGRLTDEQIRTLMAEVDLEIGRAGEGRGAPSTEVGPDAAIRASLATRLDLGPAPVPAADAGAKAGAGPTGSGSSEPTLEFGGDATAGRLGAPPGVGLRYRVLDLLARGGLGEVYRAHDEELDRIVAVKLMRQSCAENAVSRSRFLLEAGITSILEHPGIVPVHGYGHIGDGRPYYAMRLIDGEPFKQAILRFHREAADGPHPRGRAPGLRQLLQRFIDVCDIIGYAHSRNILHRDLKPSNILLGPYGETLVVDWGLAKDIGPINRKPWCDGEPPGEPSHPGESPVEGQPTGQESTAGGVPDSDRTEHGTLTGTAVGTPQYMSPEQAAGDIDRVGTAADVYGLGATLYFLLTGSPPCDGPDIPSILARVRAGEIAPPRQARPWLPGPLEAICMKALELRPADRYDSPRSLAADIEHWLADEPVSTYRDPISVNVTRWGRRHRTFAVAFGVLLVSAVVGLALGTVLLGRANLLTEQQRNLAQEAARELENQLYVHRLNLAHREAQEGNISEAEELLALCPEGLRGWEWSYIARFCHQERSSLVGHEQSVNALAWGPGGARIVSGGGKPFTLAKADDRAELLLWDAQAGAVLRRFDGLPGSVHGVAISPDGRLIASASGYYGKSPAGEGRVRVWDAETGEVVLEYVDEHVNALCVTFSADGRYLAAGFGLYSSDYAGGHFTVFEVPGGRVVLDRVLEVGGVNDLAFHPDGRRLAVAGSGVIGVWDVEEGTRLGELAGHQSWVYSVAFHPDGRRLASGGWDRTVRLWDLETWSELDQLGEHDGQVLDVAFGPAGAMLASSGDDGVLRLWDVSSGEELATLRGHANEPTGIPEVAFSPTGDRLASAGGGDRMVKLWDASPEPQVIFDDQTGWITGLACPPGGKVAYSSSGDRSVARWDLDTGELLERLPGHDDWALSLAISPDGGRLASGGADHKVKIRDLREGGRIVEELALDGFVRGLAYSPDGRSLAAATDSSPTDPGGDRHGEVNVWDLAPGGPVRTILGSGPPVNAVSFSPDGKLLAVVVNSREGADPTPSRLVVFDWPSGGLRYEVEDRRDEGGRKAEGITGTSIAFSPDGRWLAVDGSGGVVRLFRAGDGRLERTLSGHRPTSQINALAFSPDGRRLASAGFDKLIKLWDPETGEELLSLRGHDGGVISLAFSRDGRRLVSGGVDWVARVWDARPLGTTAVPNSLPTPPEAGGGETARDFDAVSRSVPGAMSTDPVAPGWRTPGTR